VCLVERAPIPFVPVPFWSWCGPVHLGTVPFFWSENCLTAVKVDTLLIWRWVWIMTEGGSSYTSTTTDNGSIQLKYLSVSSDTSTYLNTPRSVSEAFWDCSDLLSLERSWNLSDANKLSLNSQQSFLSSTSTLCPDGNSRVVTTLLASREASTASFALEEQQQPNLPSTSSAVKDKPTSSTKPGKLSLPSSFAPFLSSSHSLFRCVSPCVTASLYSVAIIMIPSSSFIHES
jgi:hypothetical protein